MSDKVIPPKPVDTDSKAKTPELPPSTVQINGAEWQTANAKHQEGKGQTVCVCDCKITGKLDEKETAKTIAELSKATTTEARLTAIGKLADGGVDKFSMKDKDGTTREFRIETEKVNGHSFLHCYGKDDQKQEQVVFRAERTADGKFKQERNKDNQLVSFTGDAWGKSMSGKSYFVGSESTNKKPADTEKIGDKRTGKTGTTGDDHSRGKIGAPHDVSDSGKRRASHDEDAHGKSRISESRERHRSDDDDRRDRRDDRHDRRDDRHADRDRDHRDKGGSRFNLGETLGTVARVVAPFLLSALERNQYRDCNPYRNHRYRPEYGCQNYYGSGYDRYGYDRYDSYNLGRGSGHCGNDYDRRYGNRNYYDPYRQSGHHRNRHSSSNWLSRMFGS